MKRFLGGVPTDIEVKLLMENIGVPKVGQVVEYSVISTIIKAEKDTSRWKSVVVAWRKKIEREHNIIFKAINNTGFEALSPSGRVDLSAKTFKQALRKTGRAVTIASKTDRTRLSESEKKVCDHIQNTGAILRMTAAKASQQIVWDEEKAE